jgi:hypothetical protein
MGGRGTIYITYTHDNKIGLKERDPRLGSGTRTLGFSDLRETIKESTSKKGSEPVEIYSVCLMLQILFQLFYVYGTLYNLHTVRYQYSFLYILFII